MNAEETSTLIAQSSQTLEEKLKWHFANIRHGDKLPEQMLYVCRDVIHLANGDGDLSTVFALPDPVKRFGETKATAEDIIIGFHLHYFIQKDN